MPEIRLIGRDAGTLQGISVVVVDGRIAVIEPVPLSAYVS